MSRVPSPTESADERRARIEREDIAAFLTSGFTCTGQREYYADRGEQAVSIAFLHDYVRGNYRRLYARCLAAGLNHFSRAMIVQGLLASGAPTEGEARAEEAELIAATLDALPATRVYRLFRRLRAARVNNRRTRSTIRAWLAGRDLAFDAVKYRGHLKATARHAHQPLPGEVSRALFHRGGLQPRADTVRGCVRPRTHAPASARDLSALAGRPHPEEAEADDGTRWLRILCCGPLYDDEGRLAADVDPRLLGVLARRNPAVEVHVESRSAAGHLRFAPFGRTVGFARRAGALYARVAPSDEGRAALRDLRRGHHGDRFVFAGVHLRPDGPDGPRIERLDLILRPWREDGDGSAPTFAHPLLDAWRRAHDEPEALYALPMTVAEGFAAAHGIERKVFLERIEGRMTRLERERVEASARREGAALEALDLAAMDLTRLVLFGRSRPPEEHARFTAPLRQAASRIAGRLPRMGHIAVVVDRSRSTRGSREKADRPLAVGLTVEQALRAAAERHGDRYSVHWTVPPLSEDTVPLAVEPFGQTDLALPLVAALAGRPDTVFVISDGFENVGQGAADEVVRVARERLGSRAAVVHLNPVFDARTYRPRGLGPHIVTVGVRDADDLPLALRIARFVDGADDRARFEGWLEARGRRMVARWRERLAERELNP